jgi:uncharacterized SAM-binding protein YcdF (DUF218 family)
MFVFKKLVSRLLFPLPLSLELATLGLLLLWFTSRQKLGKLLVTLSVLLLLILGSGSVSERLIAPLEDRYPPFGTQPSHLAAAQGIDYVVVLAGGLESVEEMPVTRQVGGGGMARLVEGVRILGLCPHSALVLSGGYGADPEAAPETLTNYRLVRLLGVAEERIIINNTSWDTESEARNIAPIVGAAPFVLVTSATHMPRAVALFRGQGLDPIPAPSDYRLGLVRVVTAESFFPNSTSLWYSETAIYEFLGMLWAKLRGLI